MIEERNVMDVLGAPPIGAGVVRVLDCLRACADKPVSDFRQTGNLLPAEQFRRIYEDRLALLRDVGAPSDPTLASAIEDLREWPGHVYLVTFACQGTHLVLFLSEQDEVVAGFLHSGPSPMVE